MCSAGQLFPLHPDLSRCPDNRPTRLSMEEFVFWLLNAMQWESLGQRTCKHTDMQGLNYEKPCVRCPHPPPPTHTWCERNAVYGQQNGAAGQSCGGLRHSPACRL